MITSLKKTAEFLTSVRKIYKTAFSVHEKQQKYELKNIQEAICYWINALLFLDKTNDQYRMSQADDLPKSLNGPQGNVAAKTMRSVELTMLRTGFHRLRQVLTPLNYKSLNLLSCMTMDVEIVRHKDPVCTVEYARNFGNAVKEGMKRSTRWAVH